MVVFLGESLNSPARKLIRRFLVEIGPLTASPNLGVSTRYACEAAPCNRTNLNKQRTKQFSRQAVKEPALGYSRF